MSKATHTLEFKIYHFEEVESTNSLALDYARQNQPAGTVIVADYQTAGRGKPGNTWESKPGQNLLFSLLLRPGLPAHQGPGLTQIACRSVAKVLKDQYDIESRFKRPNDIMVRDRKICGVLVEARTQAGRLDTAVIGIGLNVNALSGDLIEGAISMKEVLGRKVDLKALLMEILKQLNEDLKLPL